MRASWPAFKRSSRFLQLPYECSFKRIDLYPNFSGLGHIALPKCHLLSEVHLEDFSRGKKYCHDEERHWWANFNFDAQVMEMINKNVSMDFEALKKHARMNYWHIDEVNFFAILKFIFISFELLTQQRSQVSSIVLWSTFSPSSSCSSASKELQMTLSRATQLLDQESVGI